NRRPRSGSPGSASAWRQRTRSISLSRIGFRLLGHALQELRLRRRRLGARSRLGARVACIRVEIPGVAIVAEIGLQPFVDDPGLERGIEHGKGDLDAPEEIATHPVGAGKIDVFRPVVIEEPYAAVLQKAPADRAP